MRYQLAERYSPDFGNRQQLDTKFPGLVSLAFWFYKQPFNRNDPIIKDGFKSLADVGNKMAEERQAQNGTYIKYIQKDVGYGRIYSINGTTHPLWCNPDYNISVRVVRHPVAPGVAFDAISEPGTVELNVEDVLRQAGERHHPDPASPTLPEFIDHMSPLSAEYYEYEGAEAQACANALNSENRPEHRYVPLAMNYYLRRPDFTVVVAQEQCGGYEKTRAAFLRCLGYNDQVPPKYIGVDTNVEGLRKSDKTDRFEQFRLPMNESVAQNLTKPN